MKIYFLGQKEELPKGHSVRKCGVFGTKWMDPVRAAKHVPVICATFSKKYADCIEKVVTGRNFPCVGHRIAMDMGERGTLHILTLRRHTSPQQSLPLGG